MLQVAANIWQVCAGVFPANSYIWKGDVPGGGILIDAGLDPEPIDAALMALAVQPRAVICTHGHFDHIGSASVFQDKYNADVYLHTADLKTAKAANFLMMAFKVPAKLKLPRFRLVDGDVGDVRIGEVTVSYQRLPGHSPGSCFINIGQTCFSGDTLYGSSLGLSKIPGEDPVLLRRSLRTVWDTIAPEILICPGHGRVATYAAIRAHNTELAAFMKQPDGELVV
ncbi:MBL fold metallo-hydrolase [Methylorubrum extorquens]|uniref:MBL fold metallo-hydrolase n=1 Tax=Methylorubrum extorquens TaxID=408 RepID=UPI001EE5C612|nr:MBL fold metallo-hydrolase [Methylorubrum extorquens]MCG5247843.1 MBL fold metallo-hydrolase [Methylorubrum extorquens]